eukprot:Sspe_Gene.42497::Locus_20630_Transcript_1_1_Confidence_1.000_Length_825::g.42497::m.42497/K12343/SRD5A1; 3-oxo-5-alpha-steroid 4-dehydrogenase 1
MGEWHYLSLTNDEAYNTVLRATWVLLAVSAVGCAVTVPAYGRFANAKLGLQLDPRLGWWMMELPATVSFLYFYYVDGGPQMWSAVPLLCALQWCVHYANRGWYFPLSIRVRKGGSNTFSWTVVIFGMVFTSLHGYINAQWYAKHASFMASPSYFWSPQFVVGMAVWCVGYLLTLHSEATIRNLRPKSDDGEQPKHKIPYGGLFRYVTNATYLAELIAWVGFMIFNGGPGGLIIFLISCVNLIPRAATTHRWYEEKFPT